MLLHTLAAIIKMCRNIKCPNFGNTWTFYAVNFANLTFVLTICIWVVSL